MRLLITYDPEAGAAYVYVGAPGYSARTVELDDSTMADYDETGEVIGVEFLGVSMPVLEILGSVTRLPRRSRQTLKVKDELL
jgi:uncharacterized protein YuzE